ncbi:MAG: hypothetical protein JF610_17370, partial [Acidobacteria bacterium]|nr:hypothetical protein [Acidobacteriota bacterium]
EWRVSRRPAKLVAGGLFLWRYCTRLAAMHVLRKLSRVARRLPPAELEPPPTVSAYADPVYGKNATITLQSR